MTKCPITILIRAASWRPLWSRNRAGRRTGSTSNSGTSTIAAGNLNYRTNNALVLRQLPQRAYDLHPRRDLDRRGLNHRPGHKRDSQRLHAVLYLDTTFASTNHTLSTGTNTFTAIARDSCGRVDTNRISVWLPSSPSYTFDLNGNLLSDGKRGFEYDDENQLIRVTVTKHTKSEFQYDGTNRGNVDFRCLGDQHDRAVCL
jgi:hypothetical protein